MTDREYLRSLGFTVGERGRFSKEMVEALADRNKFETDIMLADARESVGFEDYHSPPEPVREARELFGMTRDGHVVGFVMCSECADHMMWCKCPGGVTAPDNVATMMGVGKTIARIHPRMVELMTIN